MKQAVSTPATASPSARATGRLRIFASGSLLWPVLFFLGLSILMTWPLLLHMTDALEGGIGDNVYFVWMIGWMKKALFDLHVNPFNVWFLNYPEGWSLAYTEITPAQLLLALPFSLLGGPVLGYNAAMLLTFILSALGMFLWVRRLTSSTGAALVAGTIFGFLPYRFAHFMIGHLNLAGTQWFPIYFWGLYDLLEARRFAWKPALLAGIGLGLIALTSQYYLYMALLVSAVMVAVYLVLLNRSQLLSREFWKGALAAGLVALPLVALAVLPFVLLSNQGGLPNRDLGVVRMYSASPTDFLIPPTKHFLWGQWVGAHFNRDMWVEGTLYIGAAALVLAVIAWLRHRQLGHSRLLWIMLFGGLLALVLAMGTDLHWLGEPVGSITLPGFLARLLHKTELPLRLPGYYMFFHFPFYAKLRAFMRFGIFVLVFTSAAAGLGAAWLIAAAKRRGAWVAALLLVLVFIDFYPGPFGHFETVQARPVDTWLAAQPGQGAVAQFPFSLEDDQYMTYTTLVHGKPYVGGFFNAFPPAQFSRLKDLMGTFPDAKSVIQLHQLGVQYVLVDTSRYEDMDYVRQQCELLGLAYIGTFGDQMVFEMKP